MDRFLLGGAKRDVAATPSTQSADPAKPSTNSWVEKYRPKSIDDIQGQPEIVAALRKFIQTNELPHLLFYGPPGTGKTSTILAAARELFGAQYRSRVLELNASDERGINVVRQKVKQFARLNVAGSSIANDASLEGASNADTTTQPSAATSRTSGVRGRVSFKIVILDEADTMTDAAQSALRRIMELEASTTRFCLVCNYVSRIIEPIASRCAKFRFRPLRGDALVSILRHIATAEHFDERSVSDDDLKLLLSLAEGDFRRCVTLLQSLHAFVSAASYRGEGEAQAHVVRREDIFEIAGVVPEEFIQAVIDAARSGAFERLDTAVKNLLLDGHAARQAVTQLHDFALSAEELSDRVRSTLLEAIADCELSLLDGADEYLQLLRVANSLMNALQQRATAS